MKNKSIIVWSCEGGVGKSTITYNMATQYAKNNANRDVIVVDMCSQATVSRMLIGGAISEDELHKMLAWNNDTKTIVNYITDSITCSNMTDLIEYAVKADKYEQNIAKNLYLIVGDSNIDVISPFISYRANFRPLTKADNMWRRIFTIIRGLTNKVIDGRPCTYFVDANTSFGIPTQLAILSCDDIIVPVNNDMKTIFTLKRLFNLIWGPEIKHPIYGNHTFSSKVDNIDLPKIAQLVYNRESTLGISYWMIYNKVIAFMFREYNKDTSKFKMQESTKLSIEEFEEKYFSVVENLHNVTTNGIYVNNLLEKIDV